LHFSYNSAKQIVTSPRPATYKAGLDKSKTRRRLGGITG
jgi:hypothetical protein